MNVYSLFVETFYYRPQQKLRKGNVFTIMCQEFCPEGECMTRRLELGSCMAGGVHGEGMYGQGAHDQGACMARGGDICWGGVRGRGMNGRGCAWQVCVCGRGCAWWGACVAGGHVWQGGMHGKEACMAGGHAWTVCILLEYILVSKSNTGKSLDIG